jgi:hypothetical protein
MPKRMNKTRFLKGECTQCGGHLEFPVDAVGTTIPCPHCGQPTELFLATPKEEPAVPLRLIVWTAVGILILIAGLAGALIALKRAQHLADRRSAHPAPRETNTVLEPVLPPEDPIARLGFNVSPITISRTSGSSLVYAEGTISNTTDRKRFGVKVELDLFDATGKKLGLATDYQQVIEPKSSWGFKALVVNSKAVTAKVASIKEDQ